MKPKNLFALFLVALLAVTLVAPANGLQDPNEGTYQDEDFPWGGDDAGDPGSGKSGSYSAFGPVSFDCQTIIVRVVLIVIASDFEWVKSEPANEISSDMESISRSGQQSGGN
jgi:hypothetical protein